MERDYKIELYNEMISDESEEVPPIEYRVNTELGAYDIKNIKKGQRYEQWQVFARKLDKASGEIIEDGIKVTTSTYRAIAPLYEVGKGIPLPATGTPIDKVRQSVNMVAEPAVSASPAKAPSASPVASAIPTPSESKKHEVSSTPSPVPDAEQPDPTPTPNAPAEAQPEVSEFPVVDDGQTVMVIEF